MFELTQSITKRDELLVVCENYKFSYNETLATNETKWRCTTKSCSAYLFTSLENFDLILTNWNLHHNHKKINDCKLPRQHRRILTKHKVLENHHKRPSKILRTLKSCEVRTNIHNAAHRKLPVFVRSIEEVRVLEKMRTIARPPNHMYYPPGPGYAPHMPPPPRPPMSQPQMPQPPPQQMGQPMTSMAQPYRQPIAPRQPSLTPRQPMQPQPQRGQTTPRQPIAPRQPMMARQRAPMIRPRGGGPMGVRGPRPRMNTPVSTSQMSQNQQGPRMIKRSPEQIQSLQAKRKRMDVLVPDKHDDADCEVIAVQPKNTGLPQIQSIQGNAPEPGDNSVMHLSDSITLSVRNQPVRPPSPKKSDAKAVANILATRGITVTAAPKPKKPDSPPPKKSSPPPPVAINLNSAVSIIPTNKNNTNSKNGSSESKLTTVDLTDDSTPDPPSQKSTSPKTNSQSQKVLPFQCDLCPAKYPNSISLNKHRQSFHKTGGLTEFGIPLIDLKQPGLVHRLTSFGVYNYIPLPGASADTTFALPIISASNRNAASNFSNMGVSSILTLGPIRSLPKPVQNNINSK